MGFEFEIHYKPGSANRVADALSRKTASEGEIGLHTMLSSSGPSWAMIKEQLEKDPFIRKMVEDITQENRVHLGFTVENGRLLYKGRLVLSPTSTLIPHLLKFYHDSPIGGHTGELKTYLRIAGEWFWPGMRKSITNYVRACPT